MQSPLKTKLYSFERQYVSTLKSAARSRERHFSQVSCTGDHDGMCRERRGTHCRLGIVSGDIFQKIKLKRV